MCVGRWGSPTKQSNGLETHSIKCICFDPCLHLELSSQNNMNVINSLCFNIDIQWFVSLTCLDQFWYLLLRNTFLMPLALMHKLLISWNFLVLHTETSWKHFMVRRFIVVCYCCLLEDYKQVNSSKASTACILIVSLPRLPPCFQWE